MRRAATIACRVALAGILLYAASTKVPDMSQFAQDLANYRLLPPPLVPWAASAVVGVEVALGLALLAGFAVRAAAIAAGGLLLVFVVALSQALLRGIDLRCGCFGGEESATWWTVARDLALVVPAALLVWLVPPDRAEARAREHRTASGDEALPAAGPQEGRSTKKYW